jgi:DNA repair protein RadC
MLIAPNWGKWYFRLDSDSKFRHAYPAPDPQGEKSDTFTALVLVDVRVLDHVIVGGNSALSMAEKGLL